MTAHTGFISANRMLPHPFCTSSLLLPLSPDPNPDQDTIKPHPQVVSPGATYLGSMLW